MIEIAPKMKMVHATKLEATTILMIKEEEMIEGMIIIEEMKEEEDMIQVHRPQNNLRYSRYEINVGKQSEYILISALTSSSPPDLCNNWLVYNGATHHFFGYKEVISNLVERESNLKIVLGEKSTHHVKGFWFVEFHSNSGE